MKLVVCGDSFASINAHWPAESQWPLIMGEVLGCEAITLGRGAGCNMYIHAQVKYAIEVLHATHIMVWPTSPNRYMFPDTTVEETDFAANTIESHFNTDESNYVYENYKPKYLSHHADGHHISMRSERHENAYNNFLLYLTDEQLDLNRSKIIMGDIARMCDYHKVKTLINLNNFDYWKGMDWLEISNEYVQPLYSLDVDMGEGKDESPNHIDLHCHRPLGTYLANLYK